MAYIIDRRENPTGKNHGNRQRFIRRAKDQIRAAIKGSIKDRNLKDLTSGDNIKVPVRNLQQPSFGHDPKLGKRQYVLPGNKEFAEHDKVPRPPEDGGGSGSEGAQDGEGQDEFTFILTKDEFMEIFFDDLELPNLTKKQLKEINAFKLRRSGFTNSGNPVNIDIRRTAAFALARRIALRRPDRLDVEDLEAQIEQAFLEEDNESIINLQLQLDELRRRMIVVPWIDSIDIRYRNYEPKPVPNVQAVMFAIMDVSGSMGEREKDIAKRFFLLLHMFLTTKYEKVEIVFIRHTHEAQECDEHTFFYDPTTGGTIVSKALEEMVKIVKDRYPVSEWNIYVAQASDGDNYSNDGHLCIKQLGENILPICQYMAYIEIVDDMPHLVRDKELWQSYKTMMPLFQNLQMKKIANIGEIYPVFRELFAKESA